MVRERDKQEIEYMKEDPLTGQVIGGAFEVANELGCGFLEKVYENALVVALKEKNLRVESQSGLAVHYHNVCVGSYYADLIVEDRLIIEVKAVETLRGEHVAQVLNYLRATGIKTGLLVNFGKPRLQYRRFDNRFLQ
jgi:GxxExxY protein